MKSQEKLGNKIRVNFTITKRRLDQLDSIAEKFGFNRSDMIAYLVENEYHKIDKLDQLAKSSH